MPIFESSIQQANSSIGTTSALIFNPENTSSTTFGPLGSISSTAVLKDPVIVNNGTVTVYIGSGSVSVGGGTAGLAIAAGSQYLLSGYSVTNPSGTTGQIWGNVVSGTGSTLVGLASVASVV